ncbi:Oxoglutarate and iron-dependent oxygenase degradation C-term-domain-containing protein [Xylariomycetidae sp. FL0641]|nr:Oxoglutarate and iron-dependent oxygenase degradation C-term-domain-containing protein [Xylariomycetidae sp. FL0641]
MKRKAESQAVGHKKKSKISLSDEDAKKRFRKGLFDKKVLNEYTQSYATSSPYKHSVIHGLIDDKLLRSVRNEIKDNVSFTPKETDIYKIHQSGDLANLDGLDDEALSKLPSVLALRDAVYSQTFRDYVAHITGSGPLSGRKTDMAINVYTPGCFLLCHDDVIGSRRVSYILYLTDPDIPWKAEWGGALRLFPVQEREGKGGEVAKTPGPDVVKVIPPAWNQLSFFAVQPGESFHDVEEVYHAETKEQLQKEGGRVRMAISGWFHIPQEGEDGYVPGAEEKNARNSSLMQLQGNPDQYDAPQPAPVAIEPSTNGSSQEAGDEQAAEFSEADLEFLLKYMAPTYLTPDTLEQISEHFDEDSSITLPTLLGKKFSARLREYIAAQDAAPLPDTAAAIEANSGWRVAKPPHKHRYLYQQPSSSPAQQNGSNGKGKEAQDSPLRELLEDFLPSPQFTRWLQMATGCTITSRDLLARRFRRGADYTLATGHDGPARLEVSLALTPTSGWGNEDDEAAREEAAAERKKREKKNKKNKKGKANGHKEEEEIEEEIEDVGGHEVYMAGDEEDDNEDAAVYKTADEGDNILFFQAPAWNRLSIVLRDSGALRFVKYVSRRAPGDRWDVSGSFGVEEDDDDDDEEEGGEGTANGNGQPAVGVQDDTEEEWNGFSSSSSDSDSD